MRFLDLLRMSSSNLLRRKLRTVLTVLGVVIGTASIVVMVSLGLGLRKTTMDQIEESGGLTTINVYNYNNGSYAVSVDSSGSGETGQVERINDEIVEQMGNIPHVEVASPVLDIYVKAKQGSYEGDFSIRGMSYEALQSMNIEVGE